MSSARCVAVPALATSTENRSVRSVMVRTRMRMRICWTEAAVNIRPSRGERRRRQRQRTQQVVTKNHRKSGSRRKEITSHRPWKVGRCCLISSLSASLELGRSRPWRGALGGRHYRRRNAAKTELNATRAFVGNLGGCLAPAIGNVWSRAKVLARLTRMSETLREPVVPRDEAGGAVRQLARS